MAKAKQVNVEKMNLDELKALAYDTIGMIEQNTRTLGTLNNLIAAKEKEPQQEKEK